MLPFINVFGRDVPMYGICMITGAFFAILFACLAAKKKGLQRIDVLLASFFCFIFGLIGAKILYIITDIPNIVTHFKNNELNWMWLFQRMANAGIVFYGGLIGGIFGGWIYVRMFRLDFWRHADAMIPFMPLAHAFGRLGCFCAGCCYGRHIDPPFGWYFPHAIGAPHDVSLFPVQLFESCFLFIILFPLMQFYSRKRRLPGQVVGMYLAAYGIFRFFNEFLRNDTIRGIFGGVSTSQWISLVLVPIGLLLVSGKISDKLGSSGGYAYEGWEYEDYDEEYEDDAVSDETDGFVPPCAVCTGCGECDRMRQEASDSDDPENAGDCGGGRDESGVDDEDESDNDEDESDGDEDEPDGDEDYSDDNEDESDSDEDYSDDNEDESDSDEDYSDDNEDESDSDEDYSDNDEDESDSNEDDFDGDVDESDNDVD